MQNEMIVERNYKELATKKNPPFISHHYILNEAMKIIAPFWDIHNSVAVNPFIEFSDQNFFKTINKFNEIYDEGILIENKDQMKQAKCLNDLDKKFNYQEKIIKFLNAYFDQGLAHWELPYKHLNLFKAYQAYSQFLNHKNLNKKYVNAINSFSNSNDLIQYFMNETWLEDVNKVKYIMKLISLFNGWCSYCKMKDQESNTQHLKDLIAIILYNDFIHVSQNFDYKQNFYQLNQHFNSYQNLSLNTEKLIENEENWINSISKKLLQNNQNKVNDSIKFQMIFCIDVRSEPMRRNLEKSSNKIETIGFAGFFGFPFKYQEENLKKWTHQFPVIINSDHKVTLTSPLRRKKIMNQNQDVINNQFIKTTGISSFSFVESLGLTYIYDLLKKNLNLKKVTQNHHLPSTFELSAFKLEDQVQLALNLIRYLNLNHQFKEIVVLCGHQSLSQNNSNYGALECGACGGHSGSLNALVAAQILNDTLVRTELKKYGIHMNDHTWFCAAIHITTTDEIKILNEDVCPKNQQKNLIELKEILSKTSPIVSQERFQQVDKNFISYEEFLKKPFNWSEIQPEWALAQNIAFIAAPRERTKNIHLDGKVFLQNFDYLSEGSEKTLDLILNAPLIVASWINLQYFASTCSSRVFNSGEKSIHNIVGNFGIMEGNLSDLKIGLSKQSIRINDQNIHIPARLQFLIEIPLNLIKTALDRNEKTFQLIKNEWIKILVLDPNENKIYRYQSEKNRWEELS